MDSHYYINLLLLLFNMWSRIAVKCEYQEICDDAVFIADCSNNEAILIEKAVYGRMRIGKCVKLDLGYLGCQNDVQALLDKWCSGKQQCNVPVQHPELKRANTACVAELHSYLEAEYNCVPVVNPKGQCSAKQAFEVHRNQGYISSHVTSQTGCGTPRAPWVIEAQSGQTVDLWLIDFGAHDRTQRSFHTSCHELYGFVIERDLGVNFTICGGTERKHHLYKSKTKKIELHLLSSLNDVTRYLVQYSFLGCADLVPPAHAWYKRQGNEAEIGCQSDDRVWRLYCNGNSWDGVVGNCSKTEKTVSGTAIRFKFTFSSVIMLTSVVCSAIIVIIVVVVAGTVYVKKQRIKHDIKLRTDYGMISPAEYYTLKSGYGINTNFRPPADSQPLVPITDKDLVDTSTSQSCPTMTKPSKVHQPVL